jgi:threonine/homoserine/homoserine lactone efflux protein
MAKAMSVLAALPVDPAKYVTFLGAMFVMAISPGPAIIFCIRTGMAGRKLSVLTGVCGLNCATLIWFVAAAFGLQVVLATMPHVFQAIAVAGGLYLVWLGLKGCRAALRSHEGLHVTPQAGAVAPTPKQAFVDGFFVQILNPKVTLFFSAVLPPFVDIARPMPLQMTAFATTTLTMDFIAMTAYGLGSVSLTHILSDPRNKQRFDLGASAILLLLGVVICVHSVSDLLKLF